MEHDKVADTSIKVVTKETTAFLSSFPSALASAGPSSGFKVSGGASTGMTTIGSPAVTLTIIGGGVRDNVKKHTEDGYYGGKGLDVYKVLAIGDMAGDLHKDIVGLVANLSTKTTNSAVSSSALVSVVPS